MSVSVSLPPPPPPFLGPGLITSLCVGGKVGEQCVPQAKSNGLQKGLAHNNSLFLMLVLTFTR